MAYGERAASLLGRGQHGTTFGGNPVAAAAALATIGVIERDGLLAHVREISALLRAQIIALEHPLVAGVRGEGLLLAIELTEPVAAAVAARALEAGLIINPVRPTTIRLAPPLILTRAQVGELLAFLAAVPVTPALPAPDPEASR